MKLEDQVCSLELAKRLKELGVKQESYFWWEHHKPDEWKMADIRQWLKFSDEYRDRACISAFTVAELGEMLPEIINIDGKIYWLSIGDCCSVGERLWEIEYTDDNDNQDDCYQAEPSEAAARAKMLIYLIENKLVTP